MKKILSILICVLSAISSVWAGGTTQVSIKVEPEGKGVASVVGVDYNQGQEECDGREILGRCFGTKYYSTYTRITTTSVETPSTNSSPAYGEDGTWKCPNSSTNFYRDAEAECTMKSATKGYVFSHWTCESSFGTPASFEDANADFTKVFFGSASQSNSGTATITAHFKKCYLANIYAYDAESDQFETTPLKGAPNWSDEYSDELVVNVGNFEKMYKVSFIHGVDDLKNIVYTSDEFSYDSLTIKGQDTILIVRNKGTISGEVSGTIKLSIKDQWNKDKVSGGTIVTLNLTVTNKPITITLNPAEDLSGSYSYWQSSTGTQEFSVTTSPIVKQMVTATDYSFTFEPTPLDPTKYQFDRWIVKDAAGNIVSERKENYYTFKAGESITPVFIPIDAATYIVKSEPKITYLDLQAALDRAAALQTATGKDQIVVVTSAIGKLLQGNYTITNGVTFLIPGESSYTALTGDLNKNDHFADSGTFKTYCKLVVEDNTTITVKNGKISLYAKLWQVNTSTKVGAFEHGHMELGKNCQIVVEKGGLYAFGFITGDKSSNITMKSGTITYEPFYLTDWRGGSETTTNWGTSFSSGAKARVFPIGQYYVQAIEVPITFEAGATEKLSVCVDAGIVVAVNMPFVSTYDNSEGLFGLGPNTTLTKVYDPTTDRLNFIYNGNGANTSKVKIGCMNLRLDGIPLLGTVDVNSKDYVMPIQNNIDIDVKNTTLDIKYDVALMPGSVARIDDDAIINVESNANVYVYDRGARKFSDGSGYWGPANKPIVPILSTYRPGGVQYGHKDDKGTFVAGRTEVDLVDARIILNGVMNVNGGLYTVKGDSDDGDNEAEGGADITSDGGGKINVINLGSKTKAQQWKQGAGAKDISFTSAAKLLLHNDMSKGASKAYEAVSAPGSSYTYYQSNGTWQTSKAGITGVKFYDSNNNELDSLLVTLPTPTTINGYFLATLEQMSGVDPSTFNCTLSSGNLVLTGTRTIENGKLKIPVTYTVQNKHGKSSHILSITHASCDELKDTINVVEDYKPVFEVPSSLTIYGRLSETASSTLPIKYDATNIVTVTNPAATPTNPKWHAEITGTGKAYFDFHLGTTGNGIDNAYVTFTPNDTTTRNATLKLTAVYTDENENEISSETHTIQLEGKGLMIENTLDFNNVGTITTNIGSFALLRNVNSTGTLTCTIVDNETTVPNEGIYTDNEVVDIEYTTTDGYGNYIITPKTVGQVTIRIYQAESDDHIYTARGPIEKTLVVVADPQPLTNTICLDNDNNFQVLTAAVDYVEYDNENKQLQFVGEDVVSSWTSHFSTMPGTLTFTPHGDGHWAIQESKDGIDWTESNIWWTQLPSNEEVTLALHPTTRRIKISYIKQTNAGYITNLCISPFKVHAEVDKIYLPLVDGEVQSKSVLFTHSSPSITFAGPSGWTVTPTVGSNKNLGGVLNTFYQTTVTIGGGSNVPERNNEFTLTATQGSDEEIVNIGTYTFPKPLPMESKNWATDNNSENNVNGYDESEYYYHYMVDAKNVRWNAELKTLAFLNVGSKVGDAAVRQVVFGYFGLPNEVRFQSISSEWTIEQSVNGTIWTDVNKEAQTITTIDGVHTIAQPIADNPQYVRITYIGEEQNEVLLSNLVIEGFPSAIPDPTDVIITKVGNQVQPSETFTIRVRNLPNMQLKLDNTTAFEMYYGNDPDNWTLLSNEDKLSSTQYDCLAVNKEGDITIKVKWIGENNIVDEGIIQIVNPDQDDMVLAEVRIVGQKDEITADNVNTGIWTGVSGNHTLLDGTDDNKVFEDYSYHEVKLTNAFDSDKNALFDYVIIYGETSTIDGQEQITKPNKDKGSNAKTPFYVYKRGGDGKSYKFVYAIENANVSNKETAGDVIVADDDDVVHITAEENNLRVYITGFCPYATTGYTKNQEGVFLFRGKHGSKLDIYLEDCHIYSRNKTQKGSSFYGNKEGGETYSDAYARGSGGVLVFENMDAQEQLENYTPFEVSIHTIGNNLLNSNHGCFYGLFIGDQVAMKAYQVSSPIQVHMYAEKHIRETRTTLNLDDIWPTAVDANNIITNSKRTNGFLALKKQANNAPSIDMGNQHTIVNFNGGRVQLQNSQIGSDTYKTTLAISYRAGFFGAEDKGIKLCHGIGTDAVDGTVNFLDGTVTVERMKVAEAYRQYYLMDDDGKYTSCLRTPKNTYIKGGSVCRVRACQSVTSKGGGPREGVDGRLLGQYVYTFDNTQDTKDNNTGLATIVGFPSSISGLKSYAYNLNSVTPDANDKFYFWIPDGFGGVTAEQDKFLSTWKACMTQIGAGIGTIKGTVGGDIEIKADEEVQNFLYCQLDKNIYDVINAGTGEGNDKVYTYQAPIEVPSAAKSYFKSDYTRWAPNLVGNSTQHQVTSENSYTIKNRVYYITTATADIWQTFTAPFDVANIYVMETFSETHMEVVAGSGGNKREAILREQAKHNADFAAFFGVAMAMGTMDDFEGIYDSYMTWAKIQDKDSLGFWNGTSKYTLRGKQKLTPYYGNNWREANFYLNHNKGNWGLLDEDSFAVQWQFLPDTAMDDGILLHKGETYSMMFPYCTGCEKTLGNRNYWDYWSGKFLIFESTAAPQTINGRDFLANDIFADEPTDGSVVVTGNSTFANLDATDKDIYVYNTYAPFMNQEMFEPVEFSDNEIIYPTTAFLYGQVPTPNNMPARGVSRTGKIIYDKDNTTTDNNQGGKIPTVGGGNDLFITSTAEGINVAVAQPQYVRVLSASGAVLFSGMVNDNVDVAIYTTGVYVVVGENEVRKIMIE